jgi:predicted PurR-regulated permease PerM
MAAESEETAAGDTPAVPVAFPASVRFALVGIFMILAVGALYYARSFFLPVVLAVLVTLVFAPVVRYASRRGIPPIVSAVLFIVVLAVVLTTLAMWLSAPVASMIAGAPAAAKQIHDRFAFLQAPFAALNDIGRQVGALGSDVKQGEPAAPQSVTLVQPGMIAWLAGTVADVGTTLGATLILSLFLLAQRDTLRLKLIRVMPELSEKKRSLRVLRDIENEVSHYLLTITAINAGLGICVGLAMAILGMPNPMLWGLGAMLLNYIPYIGPLVGECLALVIAVITFREPLSILLPPLAYLGLQMVEGNLVTPTILGRRLELNPVAILIVLALATWMWGIIGTVLAVPTLVVIKVFADNFEGLAPLGEFLSAETAATEESDAAVVAAIETAAAATTDSVSSTADSRAAP